MKLGIVFALVLGSGFVLVSGPPEFHSPLLLAQGCKDEAEMVADYQKSLTELVETVKKESVQEFERAFHQKTVTTKLTLFGSMVDGYIGCLQKRAADPAVPKEDVDAAKAKIDAYSKLKDKIKQDRDAIKAAQSGAQAKGLVEKIAYPM
jgi:hypothetical protein